MHSVILESHHYDVFVFQYGDFGGVGAQLGHSEKVAAESEVLAGAVNIC